MFETLTHDIFLKLFNFRRFSKMISFHLLHLKSFQQHCSSAFKRTWTLQPALKKYFHPKSFQKKTISYIVKMSPRNTTGFQAAAVMTCPWRAKARCQSQKDLQPGESFFSPLLFADFPSQSSSSTPGKFLSLLEITQPQSKPHVY